MLVLSSIIHSCLHQMEDGSDNAFAVGFKVEH